MKIIGRLVDSSDPRSLSAKFRRKRFAFFSDLLLSVPKPIELLDVGGTTDFWEINGFANNRDIHITLLNLDSAPANHPNFTTVIGDATAMTQFTDDQFDVVFSNSVIEHVGDYSRQRKMAEEIRRVGRRYFIQTPNFFFPVEPHFLFPAYHWLPLSMQIWLAMHVALGTYKKFDNADEAREAIQRIRLLTTKAMIELFPGAQVYHERLLGLIKSVSVYHGW
jgi:hypothetical protein